jgi:hypothetical protein
MPFNYKNYFIYNNKIIYEDCELNRQIFDNILIKKLENKKINIINYYNIKNIFYIENDKLFQYGIIIFTNNIYKLMLYY